MGEEDERFSAGADSAGRGADRVRAACVDPVARRTQGRQGHDLRVADAGGVCKKSGDLVRERQAVKFAAIADWADSNSYTVAFICVELGAGSVSLGLLRVADGRSVPAFEGRHHP